MRLRRSFPAVSAIALGFAATLLPWAAPAQQSAPAPSGPKLVVPAAPQQNEPAASASPKPAKNISVLAVVRDKKGQPVTNLGKQDFVLEQDGRAQTILQTAQPSELPLTIGVVADTGSEQRKALGDERKAGTDFLNRVLRPGQDRGFVLHFDREVELLQDVTASRDKLAKGMEGISTEGDVPHPPSERGQPHFTFGVGEVLYDAVFLSADEVLKGETGRKAIVLFSDGFDSSSKTSLSRAIEAAQRANVQVYCVYVTPAQREADRSDQGTRPAGGGYPGGGYPRFPGGGPFPGGGYPGGGPFPGGGYPPRGGQRVPEDDPREKKGAGKLVLQQIAQETGGRYFELSKKMNATQIFAQIENEVRHQYSLSYTPDTAPSGFHKLRVSTRNPELTVQARSGFYGEGE
jgi:VWFA-related protein